MLLACDLQQHAHHRLSVVAGWPQHKAGHHLAAVALPFSANAPQCVKRLFICQTNTQAVLDANADTQPR